MDDEARLSRMTEYWRLFEARLRTLPGVRAVGGGGTFPLSADGDRWMMTELVAERGPSLTGPPPHVTVHAASPQYFSALGQPLLSGRSFTTGDAFGRPRVMIVNRTAAELFWPGEEAVGRRLRQPGDDTWIRVVGVVGDVRQQLDKAPGPVVYVSLQQSPSFGTSWVVHTEQSLAALSRSVKAAARAHDPTMPVGEFRTIEEVRSATLAPWRVTASLIAAFALLALVITAAGLTGVIAFSVSQRTREFGVRMALGASRSRVVNLVLREAVQLVGIGLSIGMAGALVLTRLITSLLFDVQPHDAVTYLSVAMVLVTVAVLACFVPARRAASADPMVALRAQ